MVTRNRILANRRNARKSTGPKTPQGKTASSRNAVKHGLYSRRDALAAGRRDDFFHTLAKLSAELNPRGLAEELCLLETAEALSDMRRAEQADLEIWRAGQAPSRFADLARVAARYSAAQSRFHRALRQWGQLRHPD